MALITVNQLMEHVESDLSDDALQRILDSEDAEITKRTGVHTGTVTETFAGGDLLLFVGRPISAITSVTEYVGGYLSGEVETVLAADDYRIWGSGRYIQRLSSGTNSRVLWGERVQVIYTPRIETAERVLVLINLCKLAIRYSGVKSERIGDFSENVFGQAYSEERERLLKQLEPSGGVLLV